MIAGLRAGDSVSIDMLLRLYDIEGLSNEETAKILGVTVPAVKSRLHRARLYLREQLSGYLREGKTAMTIG